MIILLYFMNLLLFGKYLHYIIFTLCKLQQINKSILVLIIIQSNQQQRMKQSVCGWHWQLIFWIGLTVRAICVDCVYNSNNFTVTSKMPFNRLRNCREYCESMYAEAPQRYYYNATSQKCMPVRYCNSTFSYYDYPSNLCYTDQTMTTLADSYFPLTTSRSISKGSKLMQIVCVNGVYIILSIGGKAICQCNLLWEDSGMVDINGYPFKCDQVTSNPAGFFLNSLTFQNSTIVKYGTFTAAQIAVMMANMRNLQANQQMQHTYNQTDPILYAVYTYTKTEPIIRSKQIAFTILIIIAAIIVFGISYCEYEKLRVKVSEAGLKSRIKAALSQQNLIRSVA